MQRSGPSPGLIVALVATVVLGVVFVVGVQSIPAIKITSPVDHEVWQRGEADTTVVAVEGFFSGMDRPRIVITVSSAHDAGPETIATAETVETVEIVETHGSQGTFRAEVLLPVGWFQIEVSARVDGTVRAHESLEPFGVGEVFITAGQSNASNAGEVAQVPTDPRVSTLAVKNGSWAFGLDPQPSAATGQLAKGSPWPPFASRLATNHDVPIGIVAVAAGGSSISSWQPGEKNYENRLQPAIAALHLTGFRAVLWHQGESDIEMAAPDYSQRLSEVIDASRSAAGRRVPWGVAIASDGDDSAPVANGQRLVISQVVDVFAGPNTNDFRDLGLVRDDDSMHFNDAGLKEHGERWAASVAAEFDFASVYSQ